MSIDGRMTIANMSIEMGAKNCFMEPDERRWNGLNQEHEVHFK
jgi:homoaconitase/3-isopropylmalate dehydratase large subunit